jgi:hypothetical protein
MVHGKEIDQVMGLWDASMIQINLIVYCITDSFSFKLVLIKNTSDKSGLISLTRGTCICKVFNGFMHQILIL